jgi:hypothetical protein
VTVQTSGRVDGLALFNVSAGSVHVVSMDGATEIFNETYSLAATSGIDDWYSWFFEPIDRITEMVVPNLPVYADQTITVTISDPGATVAVGNLVIGQTRDLGLSLAGAQAGIIDYSKKVADDFGNYSISERAFSDTLTSRSWSTTTASTRCATCSAATAPCRSCGWAITTSRRRRCSASSEASAWSSPTRRNRPATSRSKD